MLLVALGAVLSARAARARDLVRVAFLRDRLLLARRGGRASGRVHAVSLTRRGLVTVRIENSGVGDSEGAPCPTVDLDNEAAGYAAALHAMEQYPYVDPSRVFLFGHSIGGIRPRTSSPVSRSIGIWPMRST